MTFENVGCSQDKEADEEEKEKKVITVEPHIIPSRGPYIFNEPKKYALHILLFIIMIAFHWLNLQKYNSIHPNPS